MTRIKAGALAFTLLALSGGSAMAQSDMMKGDMAKSDMMKGMSKHDMMMMKKCQGMEHGAMMKSKSCMKMMKKHPDMMSDGSMMKH